jgi:hypothetical protein
MNWDFVRFAHEGNGGGLECRPKEEVRDVKMTFKTLINFKTLTISGVAILGFVAGINGAVRADSSSGHDDALIVAQNEAQTATGEKSAPSTESREPETKAGEAQESTATPKKSLKNFKPSEQIEAEQAVDFPYDI